jgi:hypothetical protein
VTTHLLRDDGQHFEINTVELIKARPGTRRGQALEELALRQEEVWPRKDVLMLSVLTTRMGVSVVPATDREANYLRASLGVLSPHSGHTHVLAGTKSTYAYPLTIAR